MLCACTAVTCCCCTEGLQSYELLLVCSHGFNSFITVQGRVQLLPQLPAHICPHLHQLQVHLHPAPTTLPHLIQTPTHHLPLHLPQQVLPQLLTKRALLNGRSVAAPTSAPPTAQMRHGVICSVTVD